jgi:rod shape-determining protein MreB
MKDGVIADFHVAEQLLRRFIQMTLDRYLFRVKPTVIVCVPSSITEVERRAVRDAARSAGVKRLFMVSEPIAAAIGAGLPVDQPVGNMIVDVGGGTTDVAVIALSGVVCDASIRTAGDELDQSIVQYMRKNYSLLIGEPTAELVKMRIGSAMPFEREVEMEVKGRDLVSGLPRTVTVESAGIRDAIAESIQRIVNAVRRALELTPPELARDILENGIMLTGGGALIRGLDALLTFETGLPVRIDVDPLTSVVRGTGHILDDMPRFRDVLLG